jgi:hypothetical protein
MYIYSYTYMCILDVFLSFSRIFFVQVYTRVSICGLLTFLSPSFTLASSVGRLLSLFFSVSKDDECVYYYKSVF